MKPSLLSKRSSRGDVSIFFVFIILTILASTAIVLGVLAVTTLRGAVDTESSTQAFYAADTGIEHARWRYTWEIDFNNQDSVSDEACRDAVDDSMGMAFYRMTVTGRGESDCPTPADLNVNDDSLCIDADGWVEVRGLDVIRRATLHLGGDC